MPIRKTVGAVARQFNPPPKPEAAPEPETPAGFDGQHSKHWWKTRDEEQSTAQGYWDQREKPARRIIAEEIARLQGNSLLEIGCHAGPNLWAACQLRNFDRVAGVELSPTVLDFTRKTLPAALGRPVDLYEASAEKLPFKDGEFDITLLSMVLLCIGPDDIEASLKEIFRVTKSWIVICEVYDNNPNHASLIGLAEHFPNTTYWTRNYISLLQDSASFVGVRHIDKPDQLGHLRSVMIFSKY